MKKAPLFKINWKDVEKGFIIAAGTAFGNSLLQMVGDNHLPSGAELIVSLKVGLVGGIVYLIKNLLTNSQDKILGKEQE